MANRSSVLTELFLPVSSKKFTLDITPTPWDIIG